MEDTWSASVTQAPRTDADGTVDGPVNSKCYNNLTVGAAEYHDVDLNLGSRFVKVKRETYMTPGCACKWLFGMATDRYLRVMQLSDSR